jgi:endonuclease YncB( thermonuclease family)
MVAEFLYPSKHLMIKLRKYFLPINIIVFLVTIYFFFQLKAEEKLVSNTDVIVVDGDTIKFNNKKIRLQGIDTPEIKQLCKNNKGDDYKCGVKAKLILINLIGENQLKCIIHGEDRYKRLIGTCFTKNININQWLVKNGWALAYRKYSKNYIEDEKWAKNNLLGLWQGNFIKPCIWRKNN